MSSTKYTIVAGGVVVTVFSSSQVNNPPPGYAEILDTDPLWIAYQAALTGPQIPPSVALWRAKAVLYGTAFTPSSAQPSVQALLASCTTLGAAADALVAAQNNHALSAFWVSAGDIYRSSAALAQIAGLLNLSSATIDALFIAAEDIPPL